MAIGNDIVDLADAGVPTPRFVARVLAPAERAAARDARTVWRMWAAKEAAFKLLARADRALAFAHRHFVVDLDAGLVRHQSREVRVRWLERDEVVGCVAWRGETEVAAAVARVGEPAGELDQEERSGLSGEPSVSARLLCKRLLHERLGIDGLRILRPGHGPPVVWRRGRALDGVAISLSHDGGYVACAVGLAW